MEFSTRFFQPKETQPGKTSRINEGNQRSHLFTNGATEIEFLQSTQSGYMLLDNFKTPLVYVENHQCGGVAGEDSVQVVGEEIWATKYLEHVTRSLQHNLDPIQRC
jgi:hypothetical protein